MPIDYCLNYCDFSMNYCFQGCLNISFEDQRRIKASFFSLQKVRGKKKEVKSSFSYLEETVCTLVSAHEGEQKGVSAIPAVSQSVVSGAQLKSLYANPHNIGNNQEKLRDLWMPAGV